LFATIAYTRYKQRKPLKQTVNISRDTIVGSDTPQRASALAYSFPEEEEEEEGGKGLNCFSRLLIRW
jgi:hypothetical protein